MGKRGRPPKKKPIPATTSKADQCYTMLSSDEEISKKNELLRLPSPSQRRGVGNEHCETITITPSTSPPADRTMTRTDINEERTSVTRSTTTKKKIIINQNKKNRDASGDTDATEVYVRVFFFFMKYFNWNHFVSKNIHYLID